MYSETDIAPLRAWVDIDTAALRRNAFALANRAGVPLLPVVKADGYGCSAPHVARSLAALNPWGFAVATPDEGGALRDDGIDNAILVLTPSLPDELGMAWADDLRPSLDSRESIATWIGLGGGPWHLAIDTGINRSGAPWQSIGALADILSAHPPEGAYSHFHSADTNPASIVEQEARFRAAIEAMPARPPVLHMANSAAIVRQGASPWDLVRPGVFLYGSTTGKGAAIAPEPVVSVRARVVALRTCSDGDTVSYGATWRAHGERRIATLGIGYADGVHRSLGNRGEALLAGRRVPIVGVVTMDLCMVDVTDVPCELGDVATIVGQDGDDMIGIDEMAEHCGTVAYELLVAFRLRLPRRDLERSA
jgi:alanine racemase